MADLRRVIIKLWDYPENKYLPPLSIQYFTAKGIDKEYFKQIARERFEKILQEWEEENETD